MCTPIYPLSRPCADGAAVNRRCRKSKLSSNKGAKSSNVRCAHSAAANQNLPLSQTITSIHTNTIHHSSPPLDSQVSGSQFTRSARFAVPVHSSQFRSGIQSDNADPIVEPAFGTVSGFRSGIQSDNTDPIVEPAFGTVSVSQVRRRGSMGASEQGQFGLRVTVRGFRLRLRLRSVKQVSNRVGRLRSEGLGGKEKG